MADPQDTLDLWDYRRRVADIYAAVRQGPDDQSTWQRWVDERDRLFRNHPQSPLDAAQRVAFDGLDYFPYDPAWRFSAAVEPLDAMEQELEHSGTGSTASSLFGVARFFVGQRVVRLPMYWLNAYGGGVFVPFRDATNGAGTYAGGRYLLDTTKGADLGHLGNRVVLDFNYAYHPSCVHSTMWSCPLAPPVDTIDIAVRAGERLAEG